MAFNHILILITLFINFPKMIKIVMDGVLGFWGIGNWEYRLLEQYIKAGVGELDRSKLPQLLELKYHQTPRPVETPFFRYGGKGQAISISTRRCANAVRTGSKCLKKNTFVRIHPSESRRSRTR